MNKNILKTTGSNNTIGHMYSPTLTARPRASHGTPARRGSAVAAEGTKSAAPFQNTPLSFPSLHRPRRIP